MSYTRHNWIDPETINAAKLNNIEDGIEEAAQSGGGAMICNASWDDVKANYALDKTAQEIYDALVSGTPVYIKYRYGILGTDYASNFYLAPIIYVWGYNYTQTIQFMASKPTFISSGYTPAALIFRASGLNEYPVFLETRVVNWNSTTDASIV